MTILHDETVERPFEDPPELTAKPDWKVAFGRARSKFSQDGCTDLAAALTYYSIQSMFPGLIAVMSLLNIFGNGKSTTTSLVASIGRIVGKDPKDLTFVTDVINNVQTTGGGVVALIIGLVGALWSASGYVGAMGRALNKIYAAQEGRKFVPLKATLLAVTAIELILIVIAMLAIVVSGSIAREIGKSIGLGDQAVMVWDIVKWPFVVLIVVAIISMLYWATPNVRKARRQLLTWGALIGFVVWVVASFALVTYIGLTKGASYQKTYGVFAGAIILLLWLWITNIALLFGAEMDAELLRTRQLKSGLPAERLVLLPLKSDAKVEKTIEKDDQLVDRAYELRLGSESDPAARSQARAGKDTGARVLGAGLGPSQHGSRATPTSPAGRRLGDGDTSTSGGSDKGGEKRSRTTGFDREAEAAAIAAARNQRREAALSEASEQRRIRERLEAQERKRQAAADKRRKEQERKEKESRGYVTAQQRWESVDAVRAQFGSGADSPSRDEVRAAREERRAAYRANQQEARKRAELAPPKPKQDKKPKKRAKSYDEEPRPLRADIEAERAQRRDAWYSDRGR
ncbi:YihY family inner membrane protein [Calidifontibacter sp. DB0510]|uniref:YihY family inner membrane protein n=1 Tax=Metallococcus carri TaxID=1656884 RepID=A0A967B6W5_9MICO|nr:YhjD/YihY/BrkB family envelope integrity protein [Metallococcus carri]NHN55811.1 YihY family inner membrane protein [Metallococcus carri]NOP38501.1 YihY family inner membrane protein [Calidifontibacter sp. DB2511S]